MYGLCYIIMYNYVVISCLESNIHRNACISYALNKYLTTVLQLHVNVHSCLRIHLLNTCLLLL